MKNPYSVNDILCHNISKNSFYYSLVTIVTSIKIIEIKSNPLIIHIEPSFIAENLPNDLINSFIINIKLVNNTGSSSKDNKVQERKM